MTEFLVAVVVFALALAGMAVGVMVRGRPIKGSCGGINNIEGVERVCGCNDPCELKQLRMQAAAREAEAVS